MTDRRRANSSRPAEEIECWSHTASSIQKLSDLHNNGQINETIGKVNRLISSWPSDDTLPADGYNGLKAIAQKLGNGLKNIKELSEKELREIEKALEELNVLIALRKAPESSGQQEKRIKRSRGQSPPNSHASSPAPSTSSRGSMSITLPRRPTPPGPAAVPKDGKLRRDYIARQLPLKQNRKVAFRPPPRPTEGEADWILAFVTKCIDRTTYKVQDPEPQEDGSAGQTYKATIKTIIPLPDPGAAETDLSHPNSYPEYQIGTTVLALYPDTSCFYRAEVLAGPSEMRQEKASATYKVKFEEDNDQEHIVLAHLVVEAPSGAN